ncbi:DUF6311 domain-containing protein [Ruminococcaceae bacterium OttesenSCG-928-A16]|nr:DUF6311 domain-containing protein [Ruminococcaceae bacterium OttesenSCG-928-A16]
MPENTLQKPTSFFKRAKVALPDFALGALLGTVVFLLIYGVSTLNVTYDSWIYCGYIETDIIQSYGGWMYLRQAPWEWPLTVANNLAAPVGTSISFTDSVPLVGIFFKLFAPVLPQTFQYFGIYNLFNFAMQGGFAFLLLRGFKFSRVYTGLAALLFITAPVFVERAFRHSALASQWLILAALWLYFASRRPGVSFPIVGFTVVCTLAVGLHFYFLPMLYAIFLAAILYQIFARKKVLRYLLYLGGSFVPVLGMSYVLGILTRGGDGSASGFGSYSLNLNALFNPTSFNWYAADKRLAWSTFLPVLPQHKQQYDAFNYLGAGVLLVLCVMAVYGLVRLVAAVVKKQGAPLNRAWAFVKSHGGLFFVCGCLTVYAISNVVTLNASTLFTYPLPEFVLILCGIFRSSGRLFWVCNYLLILAAVVFVGRAPAGKWRTVVLAVVVAVQLADISGTLAQKHNYFANGPLVEQTDYVTPGWQFMAEHYDNFYYLENLFYYDLTSGIIRYNPKAQTNAILANRGSFDGVFATYDEYAGLLKSGQPLPENMVYVCENPEIFAEILQYLHPDARGYQVGRFYLFANPVPGNPLPEVLPLAAK